MIADGADRPPDRSHRGLPRSLRCRAQRCPALGPHHRGRSTISFRTRRCSCARGSRSPIAAHVRVLELRVAYNDAFVAYVNGQEIARRGIVPDGTAALGPARSGGRAPLCSGAVGPPPVTATRRQSAGRRGLRLARASDRLRVGAGRPGRRRRSQRRPDRARSLPVDTHRGGQGKRVDGGRSPQLADRPAGVGDGHGHPRRRRDRRSLAAADPRRRGGHPAGSRGVRPGARYDLQLPDRARSGAAIVRAPDPFASRRSRRRRRRCASPSTATCATPGTPRTARSSRRWCARRRR